MSDYRDLYYHVADGLRLYARDYPGPSDDAPVVLCMHGLTRNSRDFADLAPLLAHSHRVIVAEQRGRGRSDYDPTIERYQPATYVGDMFELLSQHNITQCDVIGTSMGGLMAMAMNALNPALFNRVVINDIGPTLAEAGLNRIKSFVGSASEFDDWHGATEYAKAVNGVAFPDYSDDDWARFTANICIERDGKVVLDHDTDLSKPMKADASAATPPDLWGLFDTLTTKPVLLVRGELSDLLDRACVAEMQRRHATLRYVEVQRVGHAPMLTEPGVAEAICAFINA